MPLLTTQVVHGLIPLYPKRSAKPVRSVGTNYGRSLMCGQGQKDMLVSYVSQDGSSTAFRMEMID